MHSFAEDDLPDLHLNRGVRFLDEILRRIGRQKLETADALRNRRLPIPPRLIAGVILCGKLTRIRSSGSRENALQMRLDFRWLAEERSVDRRMSQRRS